MAARVFNPFLMLLARLSNPELARAVELLKTQNTMLRSRLPHRVNLTDKGRQKLLTVGKPLGAAIKELISIVAYRAFLRWKAADGVACDQWLGGLLKHYRTAG